MSKKEIRKWSEVEVRRMRRFAKAGDSCRVAAQRLGRGYAATRFKASQLGISFFSLGRGHSRKQRARWTKKKK